MALIMFRVRPQTVAEVLRAAAGDHGLTLRAWRVNLGPSARKDPSSSFILKYIEMVGGNPAMSYTAGKEY